MAKVLFVASVYSHLEAFHIPFIDWLQSQGHIVHAAASQDTDPNRLRDLGVTCWDIPFRRSPFSLGNITAFARLRRLLFEHHYDLVHVHTPVAAFMGRLVSRATRQGKVLYTAHGFHFFRGASPLAWMLYYSAEKLAVRWTDGLIVMNQEDYANARRLGFQGDRLHFVHGVGVDLTTYKPGATTRGRSMGEIPWEPPVFICVGELNRNKNQAFLIEGWHRYSRQNPGTLLIVGDGPKKEKLIDTVRAKRIKGVQFLGYRSDVPDLLRLSDVAVLTSFREGLPRFLLEAMATELPIIATNVRGNRDLVENHVNGILVEPGDLDSLVSALTSLALDVSFRRRMGTKGYERVQPYSLHGGVLAEMSAIYNRFL